MTSALTVATLLNNIASSTTFHDADIGNTAILLHKLHLCAQRHQHACALVSLVPRLFCVGGEKRAWYTLSAHMPNIQQLFIQMWHKILIITVVT